MERDFLNRNRTNDRKSSANPVLAGSLSATAVQDRWRAWLLWANRLIAFGRHRPYRIHAFTSRQMMGNAMSMYRLIREQIIARPVEEVFRFFADASNLKMLIPPRLRFQILTPGDIEMRGGTIIQYALRIHGVPIRWMATITEWNPPFEFVDTQLQGPYLFWQHRHTFEPLDKATRMIDEVNYRLPLGWIGQAMHSLLIRDDLETIFNYRKRAVIRQFETRPPNAPVGLD